LLEFIIIETLKETSHVIMRKPAKATLDSQAPQFCKLHMIHHKLKATGHSEETNNCMATQKDTNSMALHEMIGL
jgi:hypothetical protein